MDEYEKNLAIETDYLGKTLEILKNKLKEEQERFKEKRGNLIAARREMYENTVHFSNDFDKLTEIIQYLNPLEIQTYDYFSLEKKIERYEKLLKTPYFARIDFKEDRYEKEKIYIGLGNLIDDKTGDIYIYDWRSPISSVFYRYELGEVSYKAPYGIIKGEVSLKRQYEIENGKLQYFFDSNVSVLDDILKKALSGNSSTKMKNIVETIQREQDLIIRDIENELVIVQGVAGSGKTSVAMHRVAFLMYQGLTERLKSDNVVLISPNILFGQYISDVLPELGEENISTLAFEDIFDEIFKGNICVKNRNVLYEEMMTIDNTDEDDLLKSSVDFKLSKAFVIILERLIRYYEHKMIEFNDIYFNGELVASRHLLKAELLNNEQRYIPVEIRLNQIEVRILRKLLELRKFRLSMLEEFVNKYTNHPFDAKSFARILAMKQSTALRETIYKFTRINYLDLYKKLFSNKCMFYRLSKGLDLPENIEQILDATRNNLDTDKLSYEDAIGLLCLKAKMSGSTTYTDIKQVVVDEAQDYYPIHYEILKYLFTNAKYTIMGDINQTIKKSTNLSIYDDIKEILNKQKNITVILNKSFRSSYEINEFNSKFIRSDIAIESFERHGNKPEIVCKSNVDELDNALIKDVIQYQDLDYSSIAIICKSMKQAKELYKRIRNRLNVKLANECTIETISGVTIVPIYMAKGLEFDAVLVYGTDDKNYKTEEDKKLLYIACTRALHRLSLYYEGIISRLL